MTDTTTAAAWFPDPSGMHQYRYWDGTLWTDHVADDGAQSLDPLRSLAELAAEKVAEKDAERSLKDAERDAARAAKTAARVERDAARSAERATAKAAADEARAEKKAAAAARRAEEKQHNAENPFATFGAAFLKGGMLNHNFQKTDMTEATAEATLGAPSQRSTLTRMGAGAIIAGPVGLVVGAVARKNTSKSYVTIGTPDGVIILEGHAKDYPAAVKFADAVNRSHR